MNDCQSTLQSPGEPLSCTFECFPCSCTLTFIRSRKTQKQVGQEANLQPEVYIKQRRSSMRYRGPGAGVGSQCAPEWLFLCPGAQPDSATWRKSVLTYPCVLLWLTRLREANTKRITQQLKRSKCSKHPVQHPSQPES